MCPCPHGLSQLRGSKKQLLSQGRDLNSRIRRKKNDLFLNYDFEHVFPYSETTTSAFPEATVLSLCYPCPKCPGSKV